MTDHPSLDPSDRRDELASAYLDGEATPEEAAEVERDPELRARVEALRGAARAVAADVPPPVAEERDLAIARALAAFDTERPAAPVDLAAERARRRSRRGLWVASAAAALLAAVAGVSLLRDTGGDTTVAGGAASDADQASTSTDEGFGAAGAPSSEESADADTAGGDLGGFDDEAALVDAVRSADAAARTESAADPQTLALTCASQLPTLDQPITVYTARLEGVQVNAIVYVDQDGSERLAVVTPSCEVVADTAL